MEDHGYFLASEFLTRCKDAVEEFPFWEMQEDIVTNLSAKHRDIYLRKTLVSFGFRNLEVDGQVIPVQVNDNIVREVDPKDVESFVGIVLRKLPMGHEVLIKMSGRTKWFFEKSIFLSLPCLDSKPLKDTRTAAYVPFSNGIVAIQEKGNNVELIDYKDPIGTFVCAKEIRNRKFGACLIESINDETLMQDNQNNKQHQFRQWCQNLCRAQLKEDGDYEFLEKDRYHSLVSAFGYLLHRHWNEYKVVVFVDAESVPGEANGRTGKSLVLNDAMRHCLNTVSINAKNLGASRQIDKFTFHTVSRSTQYICFDDMAMEFDFSNLFSIITGPLEVQRKYGGIFCFNKEDKPKMAISSNHPIEGEGTSYVDRQHIVEIGGFYRHLKFRLETEPYIYHEGYLFEEWGDDDWMQFDLFCLCALRFYLANGLVGGKPSKGYEINQLAHRVGSREPVIAVRQMMNLNIGQEIYAKYVDGMSIHERGRCLVEYLNENFPETHYTAGRAAKVLHHVAQHYGFGINKGRVNRPQKRFGDKRLGVNAYYITPPEKRK